MVLDSLRNYSKKAPWIDVNIMLGIAQASTLSRDYVGCA